MFSHLYPRPPLALTGIVAVFFLRPPTPNDITTIEWLYLSTWNSEAWCSLPWNKSLCKMAMLADVWHVPRNFEVCRNAYGNGLTPLGKAQSCPLQWRHYQRNGVSNHRRIDCLFNRMFRRRSKKTKSSASLAFVKGIHRWSVYSRHKGPVTRKIFPFDDVIIR